MTKRQNRLALILGALVVLGAATALILNAFQSSLVFFFTPTEVSQGQSPENRIGIHLGEKADPAGTSSARQ